METSAKGLRVLVTAGGAGIGRAIAQTFRDHGARVHTCDIDAKTKPDTVTDVADSKRTLETPGQKSTTVILSSGTNTIGYLSGQQSVRLRK